MSSANGGWEYVGKKGKSGNKNAAKKKASDSRDNKYLSNEGPISTNETSFSALMELEMRNEKHRPSNSVKNKSDSQLNHNKENAPNAKKKKNDSMIESPKSKAKSKVPLTLEQSAKELTLRELVKVTEETKIRFPDSPLIWLKDIAYYLNDKLPFDPEDATFSNKPYDYPLSLLPKDIREHIIKNMRQCPEPVLQLFQEQTLQSIITNMVKLNVPSLGFRIILQCLAFEFPHLTVANLQKFIQHRVSFQNRQQICLPILWIASQAGFKDLKTGIIIWMELMLPVISMRAFTKFVINTIENLLKIHNNTKINCDAISVDQFFTIFDFIYSANTLTQNNQKQLQCLYPQLKAITIGVNPSNNSRLYFAPYLYRLDRDSSPEQKQEILSQLINCFADDNQCFSVWRTHYSQYLLQSSVLLKHLSENYNSLPSKLSKKLLKETVHSFKLTNDDARAQSKTLADGHVDSEKYCEELITKMVNWKMPLKPFLLLFCVSLVSFLAYDTRVHGSFQKSLTGKLLKDIGALPAVEQAWAKIEIYSAKGYGWISENVPIYWAAVSSVCGPYLTLFWQKFADVSIYLWNSTEFIRKWINKTLPPILEKISDVYVPKIQSLLWQGFVHIQANLSIVWAFVLNHAISVGNWLQTNVLTGSLAPENLQKMAIQMIESLQNYAGNAYHWISNQLMALVN